jgi:hypothetical protein
VEPIVDDPIAWCLADALRDCFCTALAEVSAPVGCCCLHPGAEVAWDSCDPGQAWVRVASIYPLAARFPQAADGVDPQPCGGTNGWGVVLELGAVRCMPTVSDAGELPSCEDVTAVTRLVLADAHAMRRAALCCRWRETCTNREVDLLVGAWTPIGPQGVCVGGTLSVTVQAFGCVCAVT